VSDAADRDPEPVPLLTRPCVEWVPTGRPEPSEAGRWRVRQVGGDTVIEYPADYLGHAGRLLQELAQSGLVAPSAPPSVDPRMEFNTASHHWVVFDASSLVVGFWDARLGESLGCAGRRLQALGGSSP
jgi:hypothetical protein